MKYLIVSDIHGSLPRLKQVLDFYRREHYGLLIVLGDILNYGPRNGLPEGLDAQGIANSLNEMAEDIVAIRGNCDSEVDQMLLKFPMMADYTILVDNGKRIFLTHGHIYNSANMPLCRHDAIIYGHTHRWQLERDNDTIVCNTGSVTFPKGGDVATFATLDDGVLSIRQLDGTILRSMRL